MNVTPTVWEHVKRIGTVVYSILVESENEHALQVVPSPSSSLRHRITEDPMDPIPTPKATLDHYGS